MTAGESTSAAAGSRAKPHLLAWERAAILSQLTRPRSPAPVPVVAAAWGLTSRHVRRIRRAGNAARVDRSKLRATVVDGPWAGGTRCRPVGPAVRPNLDAMTTEELMQLGRGLGIVRWPEERTPTDASHD